MAYNHYIGYLEQRSEIRIGEIEAWRVWRVRYRKEYPVPLFLRSMVFGYYWPQNREFGPHHYPGVYTFKTKKAALSYLLEYMTNPFEWPKKFALGKVHIYGNVTEHQFGYTTEYVVPLEIHFCIGCFPFTKRRLSEVYNIQRKRLRIRDCFFKPSMASLVGLSCWTFIVLWPLFLFFINVRVG